MSLHWPDSLETWHTFVGTFFRGDCSNTASGLLYLYHHKLLDPSLLSRGGKHSFWDRNESGLQILHKFENTSHFDAIDIVATIKKQLFVHNIVGVGLDSQKPNCFTDCTCRQHVCLNHCFVLTRTTTGDIIRIESYRNEFSGRATLWSDWEQDLKMLLVTDDPKDAARVTKWNHVFKTQSSHDICTRQGYYCDIFLHNGNNTYDVDMAQLYGNKSK